MTILPPPSDLSENDIWDDLVVPLYFRQNIRRSLINRISQGKYPLDYSFIIFGPPGTGKTTIVKGIAKQLSWECVYLSPQNFVIPGQTLDGVVNQCFCEITAFVQTTITNRNTTQRNMAKWEKKKNDGNPPANIIFVFDEMDELVVNREDGADRQGRLSTTMMLPLIQSLRDYAEKSGFVFFFLTNHIERFDTAIIRRGRFDLLLPLGPPDRQARFLLFRKLLEKLIPEYEKEFQISIKTISKEIKKKTNLSIGDIETDLDVISRASTGLTLEDIKIVCRRVIEQEMAMQQATIVYLHTRTFIDWIHKYRHAIQNRKEIQKFYKDFELYARDSTIYPKPGTLQEKVEQEFSSLHIIHNLNDFKEWKKNQKYKIKFSFINVAGLSNFTGKIYLVAFLDDKRIKNTYGQSDDEWLVPTKSSTEKFSTIIPLKAGKLRIEFRVEGFFEILGTEEVISRYDIDVGPSLHGQIIYEREFNVV